MSTDTPESPSSTEAIDGYLRSLAVHLDVHNITGKATGDALAEVESHLRTSGEDPYAAFGKPGEYAATLAHSKERKRRLFWPDLLAGVALLGGMQLLGEGLSARSVPPQPAPPSRHRRTHLTRRHRVLDLGRHHRLAALPVPLITVQPAGHCAIGRGGTVSTGPAAGGPPQLPST